MKYFKNQETTWRFFDKTRNATPFGFNKIILYAFAKKGDTYLRGIRFRE